MKHECIFFFLLRETEIPTTKRRLDEDILTASLGYGVITCSLATTSDLSSSTMLFFHLLCNPIEPLTLPFASGLQLLRACFFLGLQSFRPFSPSSLSASAAHSFPALNQLFLFSVPGRRLGSPNEVTQQGKLVSPHTPLVSKLNRDTTLPGSHHTGHYKPGPLQLAVSATQTNDIWRSLKCRL